MSGSPGCWPAPDPAAARPSYEIRDPAFLYKDYCQTRVGAFSPVVNQSGTPVSRVYFGVRNGASYHLEVPLDWNGEVAVWAHGYNGEGPLLCAGAPSLREHLIRAGYAWAASSFRANGYDVATGVRDSREVLRIFEREVGKPERAYMTGESMGGHITAVAIETYRGVFDAAMLTCGVLGDTELFDYFLDANVTAAALAGAPKPALPTDQAAYAQYVKDKVLPALGRATATGGLVPAPRAGRAWRAAVAARSGGTRPGFASAFEFWNGVADPVTKVPFLFGVYPGSSLGTLGSAGGSVADNSDTVYQLDNDPALTESEQALNDVGPAHRPPPPTGAPQRPAWHPECARRSADPGDDPAHHRRPAGPVLDGTDLRQARGRARAGRPADPASDPRNLHCDFTPQELGAAFDDLAAAVRTGERPAGDDVLDPAAVADPRYGCRFSEGSHPFFTASAPCPPPSPLRHPPTPHPPPPTPHPPPPGDHAIHHGHYMITA